MDLRHPDLQDRLAAEYVLGTLRSGARRRFLARLREDAALRERVTHWERTLTPMAAPLDGPAPAPRVWQGIERRLGMAAQASRSSASTPAAGPSPAGWLERLRDWLVPARLAPALAGLSLGVMLTLTLPPLLTEGDGETQLPESYVGVLATTGSGGSAAGAGTPAAGRTGLIVSSRRQGRVLDVKQVTPVPVPAGQTLFLWAIESDGRTRPIGAVPAGRFVQVRLAQPSEALFATASELALSVEAVGSTPAAPGGAYVYRGLCGRLWPAKGP